ncbi:MAG: LuxR C-terminal-related transcriptional regulator, partial [Verrucomicrobiota bacterium]
TIEAHRANLMKKLDARSAVELTRYAYELGIIEIPSRAGPLTTGFEGPTALFEKFAGSPPRQLVEIGDAAFITVPFLTTRADAEQVAYLRQQLQACADKRHVFVAAHYPSLPFFGNNVLPNAGGAEVLDMLKEHKVAGFLFGHRHRNGFAMHENTAHVLTDNMKSIHLLHVHSDHIVIGRKPISVPIYETLSIKSPRASD